MSTSKVIFILSAMAIVAASRYYNTGLALLCVRTAILLLLYAAYKILVYPFYLSPLRNLPEPKSNSLVWAHAEAINRGHNGEPFRKWAREVPNQGIMRFRVLLNQERLYVTTPEAVKEVLITKPYDYGKVSTAAFLFRKIIGDGLLIVEGGEHKRQRKALMPAFAFRHIKDLYPLFWRKAMHAADEIAKASVSNPDPENIVPQEAYTWASRTTLDIIGEAGMGYDFNAVGNPQGHIVTKYRELFDNEPPHFRWISTGIPFPAELLWQLPLPELKHVKEAVAFIKGFVSDKLKEAERKLREKSSSSNVDILSIAMKSGDFTHDELIDQMMTFLAAGHETTASALNWAVYEMCSRPDLQHRLRQEIRTAIDPNSSRTSSTAASEIDKLPLLNATVNEVLRLIPSVPATAREALHDTTILGHFVPKGSRLFLAPWAMNTDPNLWGDDALEFKPERWLGEGRANSGGQKNNYANMTFLHGPRSCIGKDFSRSELLCLLAVWVGRFEMRWIGGKALERDYVGWVTIKPGHKLPIEFKVVPGW